MKRLPGYASMILALGLTACAVQTGPQILPGNGPSGKPMVTADQQAVGARPAPDPRLYAITAAVGPQHAPPAGPGDDTYHWLEALDTPAVRQWVEAQNKASAPKLAALALRGRFQQRVAQLSAQQGFATGFTTYWGLSRQHQGQGPYGAASPDGSAFAAMTPGSDEWKITRPDGSVLPDPVHATSIVWADNSSFYYAAEGTASQPGGLYLHHLGQPQARDTQVYPLSDASLVPQVQSTPDNRYLVITLKDASEHSGVTLLDLSHPGTKPFTLFSLNDAYYSFIGASPERLYFLTSRNAPLGRVLVVNANQPLTGSATVVPEGTGPLEYAAYFGGWLVTSSIEEARSVVRRFNADGRPAGEVALPGAGHVEGFFGAPGTTGYFVYTDYLTPPTVYKLDVASGQAQLIHAPAGIDTAAYVTERLFVPGQQGMHVPLYVTHRRDRQRDGDQPLILQASGLLAPTFSPEVLTWLELGGAYAQMSVRPDRRAATVQSRESGLDDLQQAADYLVRERYTRTRRLGLYGRGSSALAVAAAMTLRPQAYGAMVAQLTTERGDETRASLDTYAPFRRVRKGLCYPPTLVTTLDRDSRVAPWEGYQLIASLQAVQLCSNQVLLRVDPRAEGPARHDEVSAQQWAFLAQWLGLEAAN